VRPYLSWPWVWRMTSFPNASLIPTRKSQTVSPPYRLGARGCTKNHSEMLIMNERYFKGVKGKGLTVQKPLILSSLLTQFLSREVSYNPKVAIIRHLRGTDFDRNDRPIFSP
jgi:hypothetical protein